MRKFVCPRAVVFWIAIALACTPPEERAEQARQAIGEAVEQGNRAATLVFLAKIADALDTSIEKLAHGV